MPSTELLLLSAVTFTVELRLAPVPVLRAERTASPVLSSARSSRVKPKARRSVSALPFQALPVPTAFASMVKGAEAENVSPALTPLISIAFAFTELTAPTTV